VGGGLSYTLPVDDTSDPDYCSMHLCHECALLSSSMFGSPGFIASLDSDVSPYSLGIGLRGLALAKTSRPKSRQTTKFTINFHPLEHSD